MFGEAGKVQNVTIAKKKDSRNKGKVSFTVYVRVIFEHLWDWKPVSALISGAILSMGYGFVEYKTKKSALNAIKKMQVCWHVMCMAFI